MDLAFVQSGLLERFLDSDVISAAEVAALLKRRGVLDGTPVFLDAETQMPVPPLCEYGRYLSTALLDETTLKDYGRAVGRLDEHLAGLGSDVLSAVESDLVAYRDQRTRWQKKPIGWSTWGKESFVQDDLYGFLVDRKILTHRPARVAARGRNALAPQVRSSMGIRHLNFEQYRYFRDVGLGGQLPDVTVDQRFRGWSPLRGRAGSDLALGTGGRWREWSTVLLPEIGLWPGMPGGAVEYTVQACAKYGKARTIYVPEDAVASADLFCLLERPDIVRSAARGLERKARDLFVVGEVDVAGGRVRGVLDGVEREFQHVHALGRIDFVIAQAPDDAWERHSCGNGAKGPRVYDWAAAQLPAIDDFDGDQPTHQRWVLARRSLARPDEIAYYLAYASNDTAVADLVRIAGTRWAIEVCQAKCTDERQSVA